MLEDMPVIVRHTERLFDNLWMISEKYFRDNEELLTHDQRCEVRVTTAANFLRYMVHTCVRPELHEATMAELSKNILSMLEKGVQMDKDRENAMKEKADEPVVSQEGVDSQIH
jgi:hypothetical protein